MYKLSEVLLFLGFFYNLKGASSQWSAHRIRAENESKFDAIKAAREGRPILFTGEVTKRSKIGLTITS